MMGVIVRLDATLRGAVDSRALRIGALVAVVAGVALLTLAIPLGQGNPPYRIDLDVYRIGGRAVLDGIDLYGRLPDTSIGANLPFTYPPIAAILFAPLALLPFWLANIGLTLATLATLLLVIRASLSSMTTLVGDRLTWASLMAFAPLMWLAPVVETIGYGQVNVLLMGLVVVDAVYGRGRKWQGALIGVAIAIKLTPAVFLAYFLVQRNWASLARTAGATIAYTAIGFAFLPATSLRYWTSIIVDPSRIGGLAYTSNQSINGLLVRLGVSDGGGSVWFAACAAIGIGCLFLMHRLFARGEALAALLVMAFYALLASPVSWSHHWVWVAPALIVLVLWAMRGHGGWLLALAAVGVVVFYARFIWLVPHEHDQELRWNWWQVILGNSQLLWGLAFLAALTVVALRRPEEAAARQGA